MDDLCLPRSDQIFQKCALTCPEGFAEKKGIAHYKQYHLVGWGRATAPLF